MNGNNIDSENPTHPELASVTNKLNKIDLAVNNRAIPYGYIEAGQALQRVQDEELFKPLYKSFNDFCLNRYQFQGEQGYKFIRARNLAKFLESKGFTTLPEFEGQARYLVKLLKFNQHDIIISTWLDVTSSPGKITLKKVEKAVKQHETTFTASSCEGNPSRLHRKTSRDKSSDTQGKLGQNNSSFMPSQSPTLHEIPSRLHIESDKQLIENLREQLKKRDSEKRELKRLLREKDKMNEELKRLLRGHGRMNTELFDMLEEITLIIKQSLNL